MVFRENNYLLEDKVVSDGEYGEIVIGTNSSGDKFAVKRYKFIKKESNFIGFNMIREVDILKRLSGSDHVSRIVDIVYDNTLHNNNTCLVVMELADMSGYSYLKSDIANPALTRKLCLDLLLSVEYIHHMGIVHRDIKPENVLVKKDYSCSENFKLILCDFGISGSLTVNSVSTPSVCASRYRPPEVFYGIDYTQKVDVWSVSLVIYEMFTQGEFFIYPEDEDCCDSDMLWLRVLYESPRGVSVKNIEHYEKYGKKSIKYDDTKLNQYTSTFDRLKKNKDYNTMNEEFWIGISELIDNGLNFNDLQRPEAREIIDHHFEDLNEYVSAKRNKNIKDRVGDIISIKNVENKTYPALTEFSNFIEDNKSLVDFKVMFHAIDFVHRYILLHENDPIEIRKVVRCSIYLFHKYFSTLTIPLKPSKFFRNINIDENFIVDFEKEVLGLIMQGFSLYRYTLFEACNCYNMQLTDNKKEIILKSFLKISDWSKGSYRKMFREIYNENIKLVTNWDIC